MLADVGRHQMGDTSFGDVPRMIPSDQCAVFPSFYPILRRPDPNFRKTCDYVISRPRKLDHLRLTLPSGFELAPLMGVDAR